MPHYRYVAKDWKGRVYEGKHQAASLYDLHAFLDSRHLRATRVVDITGVVEDDPAPPVPPQWPRLAFPALFALLAAVDAATWLPLPTRSAMLLVPAMAALTLAALLVFRAAFPGPILGPGLGLDPRLLGPLKFAPASLRLALAGGMAAGLAQVLTFLVPLAMGGTPSTAIAVRGFLGLALVVPLLVIASGWSAALLIPRPDDD